jgi:DNA-binding response OmpR family regulator
MECLTLHNSQFYDTRNVSLAVNLLKIERCIKEKDISSGLNILSQLIRSDIFKSEGLVHEKVNSFKNDQKFEFGSLSIDKQLGKVVLNDEIVELTTNEFKLLIMLVENPDVIISRDTLHETILKTEYDGLNRSIDNTVSRIRKKLGDDCLAQLKIKSIRGKGYLFSSMEW